MLTLAVAVAAFVAGFAAGRGIRRRETLIEPPVPVTQAPAVGEHEATLLVCELGGVTDASSLRFLDDLQRVLAGIVADEGGEVERFAGERILARFDQRNHARAAVEAAVRMINNVEALGRRLRFEITIAVGVHSGAVIAGAIGSGDAFDIAARLEAIARDKQRALLVSAETRQRLGRSAPPLEAAGEVTLDGLTLRLFALQPPEAALQLPLIEVAPVALER